MRRSAVVLAIVIAVGGCARSSGKAEDKPAPAPVPSAARVEPAEAAAASLPADFPKAIPLYPGAKVVVATRSETLGKPAWAATLETPDGADAVSAFYKAGLGAFKRESGMRMADTDMSVWQGRDYDLTLMVTASADKTTVINLSVARK
jgi:hypothetical protein